MKRIVKVYAITRQGDEVLVGTSEASKQAVQALINDYLNSFAIGIALSDLGRWVSLVRHYAYSFIRLVPERGRVRIFRNDEALCTCAIDYDAVASAIDVSREEAKILLELLAIETEGAVYSVEYIFEEEQKHLLI